MQTRSSGRFIDDYPATTGLLLVIGGFYVLEIVLQSKITDDPAAGVPFTIEPRVAAALGGMQPILVTHGLEVWRLLAAAFLHYSPIHLLMNCVVLVDLGRTCEPLLGTDRFIATYFICALGASLAGLGYYTLTDTPWITSAGASGALAGVIGVLLGFSIRHRDRTLRNSIVRWIIYIALFTFLIRNVDHAGHVGGLVTGFALGWFVPTYTSSTAARRWRVPAWIAMALCGAALGFAVWSMFRKLAEIHQG